MHSSIELSLELAAQELLAPSTCTPSVEVEDIDSIAPVPAANEDRIPHDVSEPIELTAEEIDAFLEGRLAPR